VVDGLLLDVDWDWDVDGLLDDHFLVDWDLDGHWVWLGHVDDLD